jgi:hypothetical protein
MGFDTDNLHRPTEDDVRHSDLHISGVEVLIAVEARRVQRPYGQRRSFGKTTILSGGAWVKRPD